MADTNVDAVAGAATGEAYNTRIRNSPDNWVPYAFDSPAFTVQRSIYGDVVGGDYVRGGSVDLPRTATRYRIESPDAQTIATQSSLVTTVRSYDRIDLTWGWPATFDAWAEVALVRSGFGHPSTVNDGVTIFRSTRDAFPSVDSDGSPLSIVVVDENLPGGRWFYYSLFFYMGGKWVAVLGAESLVPRDFGHFEHLWNALPPYYQWVDSRFRAQEGYLNQFLHIFGFELDQTREFVESWQEAYHADFSPIPLLKRVGENLGLPDEQGLGEIRYRALVGQLSELSAQRGTPEGIRRLIEVSSKYETLLTRGRNMMLLPDDSDFGTGPGNWVLGSIPGGIPVVTGDYTVATGVANDASVTLSNETLVRAVTATAEGFSEAPSTSFSAGSDGTRTVGGLNTASGTGTGYTASVAYPIVLIAPYQTDDKSLGYGRGVLRVAVPAESGDSDVIVVAGVGSTYVLVPRQVEGAVLFDDLLDPPVYAGWNGSYQGIPIPDPVISVPPGEQGPITSVPGWQATFRLDKTLTPKYHGIPVKAGSIYGFTVQYKGRSVGGAGIYWYDKNEVYLGKNDLLAIGPGSWQELIVQSEPPYSAVYAAPYVRQTGRQAGDDFMLMGAMFYRIGDTSQVAAFAPDYYLTLGSLDELIGEGPITSRVIGDD